MAYFRSGALEYTVKLNDDGLTISFAKRVRYLVYNPPFPILIDEIEVVYIPDILILNANLCRSGFSCHINIEEFRFPSQVLIDLIWVVPRLVLIPVYDL
jgi:hypothetical protein